MKFLFVTVFGESLALMQELLREGHQVKCFIKDTKFLDVGRGIVARTNNWKKYKDWADVVVFDDADLGGECEELRKRGYLAIGGNTFGDRLENDRLFGQKISVDVGIKVPPSWRFINFKSAIKFIKSRNRQRYVIKFNGQMARYLSYVGRFDDGGDVVNMLEHYGNTWPKNKKIDFILQEYIYGIEMAVGAFFNGRNFVLPVNITFEHKHFLAGGHGPLTPEMGTSEFYIDDESGGKLFRETLYNLKPYLTRTDYRGFIDINCMVTEKGAYMLEFTTRFGYPQLDIQLALHKTPWGELLYKVADGSLENFDAWYDFSVGVVVAGPGVPFELSYNKYGRGLPILGINDDIMPYVKLSEVFARNGKYYSAGGGYPATVVGLGKTMILAKQNAYRAVDKLIIPNAIYRKDIGDHWEKEAPLLKEWGYL